MAKLFEELGGKIYYEMPVEEIITKNNKVKGISVSGQEILADAVICNADFPYAMKNLIKNDSDKGKYNSTKIDSMDYSCSCLVFYWGVEGVYPDLAAHTFVVADDLDSNLTSIFDGSKIEEPSIYLHIPSNVDATTAPEGKSSFYLLIPVSDVEASQYEWDDETINYYREHAISTLEKLPSLQNLRDNISSERYFTPRDFMNSFNAYRGATFGLQPTLTQSNHLRPQAKSLSCEGLYFAGSSTHPGAGVPIVMQSGKICAEELRRDLEGADFS